MSHTLMLGCSLNYGLYCVRRESTCKAQHNLAPDETGLLTATRGPSKADEHTHGDAEQADAGDRKPLEISDMTNYETDADTGEHGHE